MQIKCVEKIESLDNLVRFLLFFILCLHFLYLQAIYQTWPERTRLELADLKLRLKFETEAGVQELVGSIREAWELARGVKLEVIIR